VGGQRRLHEVQKKLPITTKMVLPTDIDTIAKEIDAHQDVEVELNGHTAAVVGIADLGGGKYSVTISHDTKQGPPAAEHDLETETGVWDSTKATWSGALAGYGLNYFVVECPPAPNKGGGAREQFGPRIDRLNIYQFTTNNALFTALDAGMIDVADALVTDPWLAQWAFDERMVLSPCPDGCKVYAKYYSGGNDGSIVATDDGENLYRRVGGIPGGARREWLGIVDQLDFGVNCWGTFLNAYVNGSLCGNGNMTIRYGFSKQQALSLNPLYSTSYWEWEVLDKIYDPLMRRDPTTLQIEPYLAENWTVGLWDDQGASNTKVTVTIRSDARFMDGTPVALADVIFSLVEVGPLLVSKGFSSPMSYIPSVKSYAILNSYTLEILFDVLDPSVLDAIINVPVLPKHVWKPIIDSNNPNPPDASVPDPNLIGSGPYRFESWVPTMRLVMVANKPGIMLNTGLPGSSPITSPGYHALLPVKEHVSTPEGKHKYDPDTSVVSNVRTDNLW